MQFSGISPRQQEVEAGWLKVDGSILKRHFEKLGLNICGGQRPEVTDAVERE